MQCQSISDVLSTQPTQKAGESTCDEGTVLGWTRRVASAVGLRDSHDTARGVWDTTRPGVDMSSRPIAVASPQPDVGTEQSPSSGEAVSTGQDAAGAQADSTLANALRAGEALAVGQLFDLYGKHVERVLIRTVGRDGEMDDMVQDVFLGAYRSGHNYQGNDAQLKAWVSRIAVFTARGYLRKRKRRWWLRPADPRELPEQTSNEPSPHTHEVLRRTYAALDGMDPDLRIPLALRELESMELAEIAEACDCSVSTIKRRLARARKAFERLAKKDPLLRDWLEEEN
jgi:RNA polymerase sigma-70 factor (ECF subfamily)